MEHDNFNGRSMLKIFHRLKKNSDLVTPTKLAEELSLNFKTVKSVIMTLEELGKVRIVSNGHTSFVQISGVSNGTSP